MSDPCPLRRWCSCGFARCESTPREPEPPELHPTRRDLDRMEGP